MIKITLDIETLPDQSEGALEATEVSVPGNYSKPETIEKYVTEHKEETWLRTSFDPLQGELCAIGWAVGDGEPVSLVRKQGDTEQALLESAYRNMVSEIALLPLAQTMYHIQWIGHNISWDLRFLAGRSWILGVRPPFDLPIDAYHGDRVYDTMIGFGGKKTIAYQDKNGKFVGLNNMISQERLAKALGIPGKFEGMDGSKVFATWKEGDYEAIRQYNLSDIVTARAIYKRLNWEK